MQAGVFIREGLFAVQERDEPDLAQVAADWVRIEVEACGVCGTDLQILKTPPGHHAQDNTVLGHECVGYVVEVGPAVTRWPVGARVVVAPNLTCRELNQDLCPQCTRGHFNHCAHWTTIGIHRDGGFTRYLLAPEKALHAVAVELDVANAVWIEPLSCVLAGFHRFNLQTGTTGVVIGAGPIGILHGMLLQTAGLRVIIADLSSQRLALARQAGLDIAVNVTNTDLRQVVMTETGGQGADVLVDAVGGQLDTAIACAGIMGQICCFGINRRHPRIEQGLITQRELTLFGTFVGVNTFPEAIRLLETGALVPAVLNHDLMPIQDLPVGLDLCQRGEVVKVITSALV